VTAAANLTLTGVMRFITRAGHDVPTITEAAFARLEAETPFKAG
jgi:hypothetical protein